MMMANYIRVHSREFVAKFANAVKLAASSFPKETYMPTQTTKPNGLNLINQVVNFYRQPLSSRTPTVAKIKITRTRASLTAFSILF